jgi:hypothetical protein
MVVKPSLGVDHHQTVGAHHQLVVIHYKGPDPLHGVNIEVLVGNDDPVVDGIVPLGKELVDGLYRHGFCKFPAVGHMHVLIHGAHPRFL